MSLIFWLLVYSTRSKAVPGIVALAGFCSGGVSGECCCVGGVGDGWLGHGELCPGARRIAHPQLQGGVPGAARARGADYYRGAFQPHGSGAMDHRRPLQHHRCPPHDLYLAAYPRDRLFSVARFPQLALDLPP